MKSLNILVCSLFLCASIPLVHAQTDNNSLRTPPTIDAVDERDALNVKAIISGPEEIPVGRRLVLDASTSIGLGANTTYRWYVGTNNQPVSRSVDMIYTPTEKGSVDIRLVIATTIGDEEYTAEAEHSVIAYDRKIVVVAGSNVSTEKLALHQQTASELGMYTAVLQPEYGATPLNTEGELTTLLQENSKLFHDAKSIVIWTNDATGMYAFMRAFEQNNELLEGLQNQSIILVTDGSLNTLSRAARGPFTRLHPEQIVVTRRQAINPLLSSADTATFLAELEKGDIDFLVVDDSSTAIRPWNMLSSLVSYMIAHGVSSQIVILLLILPIIATILATLKQVVGITTYGLYGPSILALSFLALGWQLGIIFLLVILVVGYFTRSFMKQWRIMYIPKVAILLTVISLTLLILLAITSTWGMTLGRDTIFILLIMSTLSENLLNVRAEEGWLSAIMGMAETVLAALLCTAIVTWPAVQSIILAYPELIVLTVFINLGIGRFTGLRLVEYFRFREVIKHIQE